MIKLCTKDAYFNFNGTTDVQKDEVAMASPLAPAPAGIFMVELERAAITKLSQHLQFWNVVLITPSFLLVMDNKDLCCHASIVFIIPSSLHMKLKKKVEYPFLTS